MRHSGLVLLLVWLLGLAAVVPAQAQDNWRTRAYLEVAAPGLIEAVVPPELISRADRGTMDFALTGPDGHLRAYELYWREPVGETRLLLKPSRVQLDPAKGFIWEAELPEKLLARRLLITLDQAGVIGKLDVYGRLGQKWNCLVRNAAVFTAANQRQARIDIAANAYCALRLDLTGYDRSARRALSPVKTVVVEGERQGRDYVQRVLTLDFQQSASDGVHVIEAVLPGDGLWIESVDVKTEAQFQGDWQMGAERIAGGSRSFEALLNGRLASVNRHPRDLGIGVHQIWPGRLLVLKLDAAQRYIGDVASLTATVRLPRLVFAADKAGRYAALSGNGKSAHVRDYPGDIDRKTDPMLSFSAPEANPSWRLASLVEKFQIQGGPFSPDGYTWRAPVRIAGPGFYRLPLNLKASLAPRRTAIRMVREDIQVPYVTGRPEDQSLDLESTPDYDAQNNVSTWVVRLPQASPHWKELTFYATGIFKRDIEFQKPKPGTRSWQPWHHSVWESRGQRQTALRLSLRDLSPDTDAIRLVMAHGDNQPVAISRITVSYSAPTVYFLAHAAGDYTIYGGNPDAAAPQYDLSLVQNELFSALPAPASMGELDTFQHAGWKHRLSDAFKETGIGLYAVLGLMTLVLLIVIVRLFPAPADKS